MRKDKGLNSDLDRLPMLTWIMFLKFLDDMEDVREEEAKLAGRRFRPAVESPYRWRDWAAEPDGITGPELIAFINQDEAVFPDGSRNLGLFAYLRSLESFDGDRRDVIAEVFRGMTNRMTNGYLLRDVINKVNQIHFRSKDEILTLGRFYETMLREMRDAAGNNGEFYTPRPLVKFIVKVTNPELGEVVLDPAAGTGGFLVETFEHLRKQCRTADDWQRLQRESLYGIEAKSLPYLLCQMNLLLHGLEYPQIDPLNALRFPLREIGEKDRVDIIMTNPPFGGEEERGILSNFPHNKQTAETALLFLQLIMKKLRRPTGGHKGGRAAVVVPESVMGDSGVAQAIRKELIEEFNLHTIVRLPKGVFEPYSDIQTNVLFFDTSPRTGRVWFFQHEVPAERQGLRNPGYTQTYPLRYIELEPLIQWWSRRCETGGAWSVSVDQIVNANHSFDFRSPESSPQATPGDTSVMLKQLQAELAFASKRMDELLKQFKVLEEWDAQDVNRKHLGGFLKRVKYETVVEPETEYDQITVKLYGKGVIRRRSVPGAEIKTRPQFVAKAGHLIMSRIDARNGAFGIVPETLDGALITNDFPLFEIDEQQLNPKFLALMLRSSEFGRACANASRGTTNRKRLKEELFLSETIPLPEPGVQGRLVEVAEIAEDIVSTVRRAGGPAENLVVCLADLIFG